MRALVRLLDRPAVALAAVALVAAVPRFWNLGTPPGRIFDEVYYSKSGCLFVGFSPRQCGIRTDDERYWVRTRGDTGAWVHPPLGKWAIGLGELAFGPDAFGWRVAAAVFGTLSVVVTAGVAQLLWGSALWTFTAGLLLATEHLSFVHSRMAMLDVFVAFWMGLAFLLLLLDRRSLEAAGAGGRVVDPAPPGRTAGVPAPLFRPWRLATGVALGAAVATKWSGLTAVLGVGLLSFAWEVERRRGAGLRRPTWRAVQEDSFGIVLSFLVVPALVYVASYAGWFVRFGLHPGEWLRMQTDIATFHLNLKTVDESGKPIHPYMSQAWTWILDWRPILYFAEYDDGVRRVVYALGNPAVFWGSLLAVPYAALAWWRRGDWRAGFVLAAALSLYLPWLLVSRPQFIFYMVPVVPALVLVAVHGLRDLAGARLFGSRSRPWLPVAVGLVLLSVGLFAFFWPVLTGLPVTDAQFQLRSWFPTWV